MPKNKEIGGCAGTQYGCCPDGVTAKKDADGSNCHHSKVKTLLNFQFNGEYYSKQRKEFKYLNLGELSFTLENYHNKSILKLGYAPTDFAKTKGLLPKTYSCIMKFKHLSKNNKSVLREFFRTIDEEQKLINVSGSIPTVLIQNFPVNITFIHNAIGKIMFRMLIYLTTQNTFINFYRISLTFPDNSYVNSSSSLNKTTWNNPVNKGYWTQGRIIAVVSTVFVTTIAYFWEPILTYLYPYIVNTKIWYNNNVSQLLEADAEELEQRESFINAEFAPYMDDEELEDLDNCIEDAEIHEDTPKKGLSKTSIYAAIALGAVAALLYELSPYMN
jgi:hypothetical protein